MKRLSGLAGLFYYIFVYVGIRGVLALTVLITLCVLIVREITVPSEFYAITGVVLGYYFARTSDIESSIPFTEDKNGKQQ